MERKSSDLHLKVGNYPHIRVDGELLPLTDQPRISAEDMLNMAFSMMSNRQKQKFKESAELDMAYGVAGLGRFRVNVFQQRGNVGLVLRVIPTKIRALEELYLPKIIWDSSKSNFDIMTRAMGGTTVQQEFESVGMYYSVNCAEEADFDTLDTLENADKNFPKLDHVFNMVNYYTVCKNWDVKPAPPIERQPVTSAIPTLILSGEYDPITPPSYGYLASQTLRHSFLFQFPGVGHGVSIAERCPYDVTLAFLDNPTMRPDIGCVSFMQEPEFLTPYSQ